MNAGPMTSAASPISPPAAGLAGLLAGGDAPSTEQQEAGEQGSFTEVLDGLLAALDQSLGQPLVQQPVPVAVPVDPAADAPEPATAEPGEVPGPGRGSGAPDAVLPAAPDAAQRPVDDPVLVALRAAQVLPPVAPVLAAVAPAPAAPVEGAPVVDPATPQAQRVEAAVAVAPSPAAATTPAPDVTAAVVAAPPRERAADEAAPPAAPTGSATLTAVGPLAGGAAAAVDAPPRGDAPAPVSRQLADAVQQLVRSGEGTSRMTLRLDPGSLGEVRIHLVVRDGGLQVSLAAGPDALAALGEGADELVRLLQAGGPADVRLSVRDLGSDTQQATQQPGQQPGQQQDRQAGQQPGQSLSDDRADHARRVAPASQATTDPTTTARPGVLRTAPHDPTGWTSSGVDLSL